MTEQEMAYINELYPTVRRDEFTLIGSHGDIAVYEHKDLGRVAVGPNVGDEGPATFDESRIAEFLESV